MGQGAIGSGCSGAMRGIAAQLLRDMERERVYLTMDMWDSREAYEEFRKKRAVEYAQIDEKCEGLTKSELHLGTYTT